MKLPAFTFTAAAVLMLFFIGCISPKGDVMHFEIEMEVVEPDGIDDALQTIDVLMKRIENIATSKKIIFERQPDSYRYNVEFSTTSSPEAVRQLLTTPGNLTIWETYDISEFQHLPGYLLEDHSIDTEVGSALLYGYTQGNPCSFPIPEALAEECYELLQLLWVKGYIPRNSVPAFGELAENNGEEYRNIYMLKSSHRENGYVLSGANVKKAKAMYGHTNNPEILLELDEEGKLIFSRVTYDNIGRQLAFVLDDVVLMAPMVQSGIDGGKVTVTGPKDMEEAAMVAIMLNHGMLRVPVNIVTQ